jgi:hypothetical protein
MRAVVLAYCSLGNPKPWISIQAGAKLEFLYDLTNMGSIVDLCLLSWLITTDYSYQLYFGRYIELGDGSYEL